MRTSVLLVTLLVLLPRVAVAQSDPLPSWNDGSIKQAIVGFVGRVTRAGGPDFVPPAGRIAVFDNDGTLWEDTGTPVVEDYATRMPFKFTGKLVRFTIELK